ncbi:MAG: AsmA-like C-terminal region-containing protein, partial [Deltaproteobacteria bacterium]
YKLSEIKDNKAQSITLLENALKRKVSYDERSFVFSVAPSFVFSNVKISHPNDGRVFLFAPKVVCKISVLPLIFNKVVISKIEFQKPQLNVIRYKSGEFNFSDMLDMQGNESVKIKGVAFVDGSINFDDMLFGQHIALKKIQLDCSNFAYGQRTNISLSAFTNASNKMNIYLNGFIDIASKDEPINRSSINMFSYFDSINLQSLYPYIEKYFPNMQLQGNMNIKTRIVGGLHNIYISVEEVLLRDTQVVYPKAFRAPINIKNGRVSFRMKKTPSNLDIDSIHLNVDGLNINGFVRVRDMDSSDPFINAVATGEGISLTVHNDYIPKKIIPVIVMSYIDEHIPHVNIDLEEGRIAGRISQIKNISKDENYRCLYIRAVASNGSVRYKDRANKNISFTNIGGVLELKEKDFNLKIMRGVLGNTPLKLDGKITNYIIPNETSSYVFNATLEPHKTEVQQLLEFFFSDYAGNSFLSLNGSGEIKNYSLSGKWNLTPANYSLAGKIKKNIGKSNIFSFRTTINDGGINIKDFSYLLGSSYIYGITAVPSHNKRQSRIDVKSNDIDIRTIADMIPFLNGTNPSGTMRVNCSMDNTIKKGIGISCNGTITVANASMNLMQNTKRISNINGKVILTNKKHHRFELSGCFSQTNVKAIGELSGLTNSSTLLRISIGQVSYNDIGYAKLGEKIFLKNIDMLARLNNRTISVSSLSGEYQGKRILLRGVCEVPLENDGRYKMFFLSDKIPINDVSDYVGVTKHLITGYIAVSANVSAYGGGYEKFKNSVNGTITVHATDGTILDFPVIYKLFGVINFLHYFKFELPDMDADGMPYKLIDASANINGNEIDIKSLNIRGDSLNIN